MVAPVPRYSRQDERWLDMVEEWRSLLAQIRMHEANYRRPEGVDASDIGPILDADALGLKEAVTEVLAEADGLLDAHEILGRLRSGKLVKGRADIQRVRETLSNGKGLDYERVGDKWRILPGRAAPSSGKPLIQPRV